MTGADKWCAGYPPQPPHVPSRGTRGLTAIPHPHDPYLLCGTCWPRWVDSADDHQPHPTRRGNR